MTLNRVSNDVLVNILSFAGNTQESVCRRFRSLSRLVYREMVNSYRCSPILAPQIPESVTPEESYSLVTSLFKKVFNTCKGTYIEGRLRQTPLAIAHAAQESADYNLDLFFTQLCNLLPAADLSFNRFLAEHPHQQRLDMRAALIRQWMRENVDFLCNIRKLYIRDSLIKELPNELSMLVNLESLDLYRCSGLTSVPDSIGGLVNLQCLNLSGCSGLTSVPDSIGGLANLQSLNLFGCRGLKSMPNSIGGLDNLQGLCLRGCYGLRSVPDSIGRLTNLQRLDLRGCHRLTSVPDSIGGLVNCLILFTKAEL